jgi:hypothetical protein
VIFWGFCKKTYFFCFLLAYKCSQVRALNIEKSHTKIQAILVSFDGTSDIDPKGRPKSEKNTLTMEHFSFVLRSIFFVKNIFSPSSQSIHCYRKNTEFTKIIQDLSRKKSCFLFLEN